MCLCLYSIFRVDGWVGRGAPERRECAGWLAVGGRIGIASRCESSLGDAGSHAGSDRSAMMAAMVAAQDEDVATDGPAEDPSVPARRGRPRSIETDEAILAATLELAGEVGIHGMSMDDLAARAGVSKATVYRR